MSRIPSLSVLCAVLARAGALNVPMSPSTRDVGSGTAAAADTTT